MTLYNGWFSQQDLQIILGNFSNGQIRGFSESELSFRPVAEQSTKSKKKNIQWLHLCSTVQYLENRH